MIKEHTVFIEGQVDTFVLTTNFTPQKGDIVQFTIPNETKLLCVIDGHDIYGNIQASVVTVTKEFKLRKKER